jgi:hypothetical protein
MCDYSLQGVASRPAKVGDRLVSTKFPDSITRGFAAVDDPRVAVCLLPGTEVAFEQDVEFDAMLPFMRNRRLPYRVARFRQINMDYATAHHDALEFPDGKIVLVTALSEGQRATVLQLSALARLEAELEANSSTATPAAEEDAEPVTLAR